MASCFRYHTKSFYPLVVVDNTLATPIFQNPLDYQNVDIVVHSATKFLAGHHDALAGAISTNKSGLAQRLEIACDMMGNRLEEFPSRLLYEGLQTLELRCAQ
jgi:cystathionine beta-lyase/cystathionine gamma-synthase